MNRHRPGRPTEGEQPADTVVDDAPTRVDPDADMAQDADLTQLARRAADHLQAAAVAADDMPRRAAQEAVNAAVAEAVRIARRSYRRIMLGVLVVTISVFTAGAVIAYQQFADLSSQLAQFAAGDAASSEVTNARASSLLVVRRDFATANTALAAAGLTPVPDPGPSASAYQISIATGEALGTLRAAGELQKRGVPIPGVVAPDPAGGRFPDIVNGTPGPP